MYRELFRLGIDILMYLVIFASSSSGMSLSNPKLIINGSDVRRIKGVTNKGLLRDFVALFRIRFHKLFDSYLSFCFFLYS